MKIVIFGLTISSSWGNGHATLWRGLCRSLIKRGHKITFFEKDVPYYALHRDLKELPGCIMSFYSDWNAIRQFAKLELEEADVAIVTSFCPDGISATEIVCESNVRVKTFYDMDTPITLQSLQAGRLNYIGPRGLNDFDLVLSYTGGSVLEELKEKLGARTVFPLYGCVDPDVHRPVSSHHDYVSDLSYLGTYADDRQNKLSQFFIESARKLPERKFLIGGALYPTAFPWLKNIHFAKHVSPTDHSSFYSSSRVSLNITRSAMAERGYCPSGRLFEAAACGSPILSDRWKGIEQFFSPKDEIIITDSTEEALAAIEMSDSELNAISKAARNRCLEEHTADKRVLELEKYLENVTLTKAYSFSKPACWGIIPAAGNGSRIQPLAFSKELLPVGSREVENIERPKAVSEYLLERMILGGAEKICFVISAGKSDILEYYGGKFQEADLCYTIQPKPAGLCDSLFRAIPLIHREDNVLIGLPDTVWFPENGFKELANSNLSLLLFPVQNPELFDAVIMNGSKKVIEIEVKNKKARSKWVWGAIKMPGSAFHDLYKLWCRRQKTDEYLGSLLNAYLADGGEVIGVQAGKSYVDVGTLHGYREAIEVLGSGHLGDR
ncbi:MAG: hypothetical protein JWQ35_1218 [Bacteriovoracaceae bacterium]|nr:hypothetical protein [Bacteriovoracaceae bacterium]